MLKFLLLFVQLLGMVYFYPVIAQEAITTKSKKAIDAYNNGLNAYTYNNYAGAETLFLSAIKEDNKFIEAFLVLAEVYEDAGQPLKAIETYRKGLPVNESFYPYGYVRLGNLEYQEGFYTEALKSYRHFLTMNTDNPSHTSRAREGIVRCEFAIHAIENPVDFRPENLGPQVNSSGAEYWPTLSADEKTLVVTRLVPSDDFFREVQEDFYVSKWQDTAWGPMTNVGKPLNTADNEGAQTISGDGRYMIFTACNRKDGKGRCDLYSSVKEGENWSEPVNLGSPVNTKYRETQPSISPDGRTLYFSSDRPGGKGHHDIWITQRNHNGQWSVPVNPGEPINTFGNEMSPFIHPDNQSLYYSSDGLIGLGGYDIFVSRLDSEGIWQNPVNLGYPINTNRDEIGLIVNSSGDKAYYSSDINESTGKDIYVFELPVESRPLMVTYMKGKVFDAQDKHLLKAEFELIDLETGSIIYNSFSDSITGEFLVSIPVNRNYMLNVSKKAYLFFSENFTLKNTFNATRPFLKDVPLQPLKAGSIIVLKNVFFETDSYSLRNESKIELDKVVKLLKANPDINIEIGGHTDNTGSIEHNQKLSENRAQSVADYLISASVLTDRITAKGYGFSVPVADNNSAEGKAQNRRTEMKVIE